MRAPDLIKEIDVTNEHHREDEPTTPPAAPMSVKGAARRRFAKAGVGASGVLMTLASTPGMACTTCVTTSGFHSIQIGSSLYGSAKAGVICQGVPGSTWASWATVTGKWPAATPTTTCFNTIFKPASSYCTIPATYDSKGKLLVAAHEMTMLEAVSGAANGKDAGLAQLFAAVYLNCTCSPVRTNYIPIAKLKLMFTACATNGTFQYSTSSTATWNKSEILTYMNGTV